MAPGLTARGVCVGRGPGSPFLRLLIYMLRGFVFFIMLKTRDNTLTHTPIFLFSSLKTIMVIHFQIFTDKIFWINDPRLTKLGQCSYWASAICPLC